MRFNRNITNTTVVVTTAIVTTNVQLGNVKGSVWMAVIEHVEEKVGKRMKLITFQKRGEERNILK
jgi:hypothetical protein